MSVLGGALFGLALLLPWFASGATGITLVFATLSALWFWSPRWVALLVLLGILQRAERESPGD